jgi:RNA polymerase sigma-70 factor, ECF subfamily
VVLVLPLAWLARSALLAGNTVSRTAPAASPSERVRQLVRQHLPAVWRTARDLGVASGDLDDVTQEVLMVVVQRLDTIEAGRERAFAMAATVRVAANWRRSRRRKPLSMTDDVEAVYSQAALAAPAEPELAIERARQLELLRSALGELNEKERAAFVLFELEELSAPEIARELGLSESAVMSRVRRARAALSRVLERKRRSQR